MLEVDEHGVTFPPAKQLDIKFSPTSAQEGVRAARTEEPGADLSGCNSGGRVTSGGSIPESGGNVRRQD